MCDIGQKNEESAFAKNLKCEKSNELSIDVLKKLIDDVKGFKPLIAVVATEPLLYKPLFEFAEYAKSAGINFHLTTNGFLLPKFFKEVIDSGISSLSVSIDALGDLHDHIRGVKGTFKNAVSGLEQLVEYKNSRNSKIKTSLNCTIIKDNYNHLTEYYNYFSKFPLDFISFSHMNFITEKMACAHNQNAPEKFQVTPSCISAEQELTQIDYSALLNGIKNIKAQKSVPTFFVPELNTYETIKSYYTDHQKLMSKKKCLVPWFSSQIIASGDVIPLARCFNISFGNINDQSFNQIWDGEKIKHFRKILAKKKIFPACTRCCGIL